VYLILAMVFFFLPESADGQLSPQN
jgi:hypothetical protein